MNQEPVQIFTIGFTKKNAEQFFTKLERAGVRRVVDTRLNNVSQLAGFAKKDDLKFFLKRVAGIDYVHLPELAPTQEMLDAYKKEKGDWAVYETKFLALLAQRQVERTVPQELRDAAENFNVRGWLWWRKVALPGVFPFYVTGAITASGGAWNASVLAEVASWGKTTLRAHGLGAYISDAMTAGDFHHVLLGTIVMSFFVLVVNRLLWRPLYWYAERKFRLT